MTDANAGVKRDHQGYPIAVAWLLVALPVSAAPERDLLSSIYGVRIDALWWRAASQSLTACPVPVGHGLSFSGATRL